MQDRRFGGERLAIEGADLVAGRSAVKNPFLTIAISVNGELKKIRAFMEAFVMTSTRPRFGICRIEKDIPSFSNKTITHRLPGSYQKTLGSLVSFEPTSRSVSRTGFAAARLNVAPLSTLYAMHCTCLCVV